MSKGTLNVYIISLTWILIIIILSHIIPLDKKIKLSLGYHKNSLLNFTELTEQYGYKTEVHDVTTEDGYILTIFHVTGSKTCQGAIRKPPVLLLHGLIESADIFLDAGPESGLGYLIPDHCFDLWVGNQRGNYYGRRHKHLDPKNAKFWDFTVEEMGYYDIPGMIDYILNHTNSDKVNFIGYSQAGGSFFIMCSERPEYCKKTGLMIALSPAAYVGNIESTAFRVLTSIARLFQPVLQLFDMNEVLYKGSFLQEILEYSCQYTGTRITDTMCGTGGAFFDNYHPGSISNGTQRSLYGHFPAGTSLKNMIRYNQIIASGKFQKYDYGETVNLIKYGTKEPPEFNISAVTVPTVTIHGRNDLLTVAEDMKRVEDQLPNLVDAVKVSDPLWTHLDIVYSQYSQEMIFPTVKKYLDEYSDEEICRV